MDLNQLYGPGFAGYLDGRNSVRQRDMQSLQGLGMLSQLQRQSEQMKLMEQDLALKRLAEQRQRQQMEYGLGLLRGRSPAEAAMTQGAAQGDIGPTVTNAARMGILAQDGGSSVGALTPDEILGLGISGIAKPKDILDIRAESRPKYEVQGGAILGGRPGEVPQFAGFVPQMKMSDNGQMAGVVPDGQGGMRAVVPAGALDTYAAYKGIDARAQMGNPLAVSAEGRAIAEAQDRGLPVPNLPTGQNTGAVQFPSNGQTQPGQLTPDQILANERADAVSRGDLNAIAEIDKEIAARRRGGQPMPQAQPQQPSSGGLNISPAQRRKMEEERPQATYAFRTTTANLDRLEQSADDLAKDPGLRGITGMQGVFPNIPGGPAANAQAKLDTLKNQIAMQTLQAMRDASKTGGAVGNVTEREWPRLESALTSLQQAQGYAQIKKSVDRIAQIARESKSRISEQYNMTYPRENVQIIPPEGMSAAQQAPNVIDFSQLGGNRGR